MSNTVLVVDDDINVRLIARTVLGLNGFKVIEAADGEEALARFAESGDDIKVVLLDYSMPGKHGGEVFGELTAAGCKAPVVVCTGYEFELTDFIAANGNSPRSLLRKPYDFPTLLETVRAA
jgi:two-component system, cell cycle sensor histidine kinase and response regulator CckA